MYETLATEYPDNILYQTFIGCVAAIEGDTTKAMEIYNWVDNHNGSASSKARIASWLGKQELAVNLLREYFALGAIYTEKFHRIIDWEPLHDYPPYQDLIKPKG